MFLLREVYAEDLDGLQAVAAHLDSVNLPDDRAVLADLIAQSQQSFAGQVDVFKRLYLFALFDTSGAAPGTSGRLIGTSMIHAQHGTRRAPHIFFDLLTDERYSETLDLHVVHRILRIGYNYNGPTEIGGLVLLPEYRRHEVALGRWLSYVRFLYMALHRDRFRDQVLSELLPPLEPDGTSLLWESLGRHFTLMSYQQADHISQTNKEFIRTLFPSESLYISLLPKEVQERIGEVGPHTKGVEKMLRKIGFAFAGRIDPFDGGPHFIARTDDITLIQASRRARVVEAERREPSGERTFGLVSVEHDRKPHFAATGTTFFVDGTHVALDGPTRSLLGVEPDDEVGILPV